MINYGKYHMKQILTSLIISILSINAFANDLVIEATPEHSLNPEWAVIGKSLIVKDGSPLIRVDTRGNCRYEWKQVCTSLPSGEIQCKLEPEWVCDFSSGIFVLPPEIKTVGDEVRYLKDNRDIKIGKMKNFLWWKWVSLESYIGIVTDIETARLIIRNPEEVRREIQFNQLNNL
tara:strand:- start:915 stop:1439 length:525 start_codon:yes stop_codon:yes gene_type:complete